MYATDDETARRDHQPMLPFVRQIPIQFLRIPLVIPLTSVTPPCRNFDCPTEVSYGVCASSLNSWRTADYTDISGETSTATFMDVQATPIQIRFRDSDSSVVPRPTDSLQLPPPMTEAEKARQRGLSTGAKAGIGVGVGVGVLAVLFCVVPYIMRARKRRREENQQEQTLLGVGDWWAD